MKILLVMRLFSHLVPALSTGKWLPMGMPAFCKLVEGLNQRGIESDVLILAKQPVEEVKKTYSLKFDELNQVRFYVVPYNSGLGRQRNKLSQLAFTWQLIKENQYDLIYCDRGHVTYGALWACLRQRVCLRLYGVALLPEIVRPFRKGMIPSSTYLSFRAPFAQVICTKDGSPGSYFMSKYLRPTVPRILLFNGVDPLPKWENMPENLRNKYGLGPNVKIILTTGRLDADKAPDVFIQAVIDLHKLNQDFFVVVVGEGSLRHELETQVRTHNLSDFVLFTGRVPHHLIYSYLAQADIYVSLNLFGNLSNAVLEAMKAGKCIVTLQKCAASQRDEHTDDPEVKDALVLIDRNRMAEDLPLVLNDLINHPETIKSKGEKIRAYADKTLKSWDERIDYEIDLLCQLASQ